MCKRILYLITMFLILVILHIVLIVSNIELIFGVVLLCGIFFLLMPLASFFYARIFVANAMNKGLNSLVCPATIMMSYLSFAFLGFGFWNVEAYIYIYGFIIFAWCEIWSLLGLLRFKHNKADKE